MAMSTVPTDGARVARAGSPPPFEPVLVRAERCKGCSLCVDACPPGVLALDLALVNGMGHHPVRLVDAAACTSCAKCARVCPDAVLTILARPREA